MTVGQKIAEGRKNKALSQEELSHLSKVSLRTIQRIEKDHVTPRPFTLKTIADSLNINLTDLQAETNKDDQSIILLLCISMLFTLGLPPGNLLFPWLIWKRNKQSTLVDHVGKKILSLQLLMTILFCLILISFPFLSRLTVGQAAVGKFPFQYVIVFLMILLNFVLYFLTLRKIRKNEFIFFDKFPSVI